MFLKACWFQIPHLHLLFFLTWTGCPGLIFVPLLQIYRCHTDPAVQFKTPTPVFLRQCPGKSTIQPCPSDSELFLSIYHTLTMCIQNKFWTPGTRVEEPKPRVRPPRMDQTTWMVLLLATMCRYNSKVQSSKLNCFLALPHFCKFWPTPHYQDTILLIPWVNANRIYI